MTLTLNNNFPIKTILGIPIASLSMSETVDFIIKSIKSKKQIQHVAVNAGKIVAMQKNELLRNSVLDADIINADGQSVVWAAKLLGKSLPERVAGIDLMMNIIEQAHLNGLKCYFFGAKEIVVKKVVEHFTEKYSKEIIAGYRNGYYSEDDTDLIAEDIVRSGADILFVAINTPKKEIFANKYKAQIQVPFMMGVGGSFDVVAGITKRAPLWMQHAGLEWFYRLLQEPSRMWKRYLIGNLSFIFLVLKYLFRK
ncbi:MAG: WecB/TagA/CpsF family glycosyltransferase [Marinilabiliaceae bacterium]|nr:WecB/TagA/CpsF family glycosyltransferase [Marinilabiliaceae bacterium]